MAGMLKTQETDSLPGFFILTALFLQHVGSTGLVPESALGNCPQRKGDCQSLKKSCLLHFPVMLSERKGGETRRRCKVETEALLSLRWATQGSAVYYYPPSLERKQTQFVRISPLGRKYTFTNPFHFNQAWAARRSFPEGRQRKKEQSNLSSDSVAFRSCPKTEHSDQNHDSWLCPSSQVWESNIRRALSLACLESSSLDLCIKSDPENASGPLSTQAGIGGGHQEDVEIEDSSPLPWSLHCELPKDTALK